MREEGGLWTVSKMRVWGSRHPPDLQNASQFLSSWLTWGCRGAPDCSDDWAVGIYVLGLTDEAPLLDCVSWAHTWHGGCPSCGHGAV